MHTGEDAELISQHQNSPDKPNQYYSNYWQTTRNCRWLWKTATNPRQFKLTTSSSKDFKSPQKSHNTLALPCSCRSHKSGSCRKVRKKWLLGRKEAIELPKVRTFLEAHMATHQWQTTRKTLAFLPANLIMQVQSRTKCQEWVELGSPSAYVVFAPCKPQGIHHGNHSTMWLG